ncbi:MAG: tricarballylate utilization 4Fe-4S protein TcuB [Silicimonas sp.]|nr:tricarballylate utilization 4Fe-4S protein TcuB [Silicimonas sp.]
MQIDLIQEARRQAEICNACRYCEGYCAVFPSLQDNRIFSDGDITQLANLCHNCRGCYYACQYTAPHEFDLNLPKALADVRQDSWETFAYPQAIARTFQRNGMMIAFASVLAFALVFVVANWLGRGRDGNAFYAVMSHGMMVAIFAPAFLLPLASLGVGLRRYWRVVGGERVTSAHILSAIKSAGEMRNLAGGHGDGCNFEDEDRFTQARRVAHQLVLYGFLLCFASTSAGTLMHYLLGIHAPYTFWSLPKLLGVPGGILLAFGAVWMFVLKRRGDRHLGSVSAWSGEVAFIVLLGFVAISGLALYAFGATPLMPPLLYLHLGAVLSFFLLTPFSKMAHGFYRFAALVRDAQRKLPQ